MTPDFLEQLAATAVIVATATAIIVACADACAAATAAEEDEDKDDYPRAIISATHFHDLLYLFSSHTMLNVVKLLQKI